MRLRRQQLINYLNHFMLDQCSNVFDPSKVLTKIADIAEEMPISFDKFIDFESCNSCNKVVIN